MYDVVKTTIYLFTICNNIRKDFLLLVVLVLVLLLVLLLVLVLVVVVDVVVVLVLVVVVVVVSSKERTGYQPMLLHRTCISIGPM